ncbi:MAG: general secretion pathway protein GspG, partial [Acidobacteria bacterium]
SDTWKLEYSEADAQNPEANSGIFNVHSGSDEQALDGTTVYSEW